MSIVRKLKESVRSVLEYVPLLGPAILASACYRVLTRQQAEAFNDSGASWHRRNSARRQERAYERLLGEMRAGRPRIDFTVAAEAIAQTDIRRPSVLELGCGNGYYSEVFSRLLPNGVDYTGLDYSQAMIESAKLHYPNERFVQGDAANLAYESGSFDIVFDGVALMHILGYAAAIREAARVARSHVILSCVPVVDGHDTIYLQKYAYGAPTIEMQFSASELRELLEQVGVEIVKTWRVFDYDLYHVTGVHSEMVTYLCRKRSVS